MAYKLDSTPKCKPSKVSLGELVRTTWETRTYDVWGNAKEGYDVNNTFRGPTVTLDLKPTTHNTGTAQEFTSAYPSEAQIRKVFGLSNIRLNLDGDNLEVRVDRARDGYPIGEMHCTSHESLSPIRAKSDVNAVGGKL